MAKRPNIFTRVRQRATRTGKTVKFASVKFGADLSNFIPAPPSLLERLGMKQAFVPARKRPSVRSTIVTPTMLRKAKLEAEEGRELAPVEVRRIRGGKRFLDTYLKQKLRFDPRLGDPSTYHPSFWDQDKDFKQNWTRDQRRFLRLAWERTGIRFELTDTGEWIETEVPGAPRNVMSPADWDFYAGHYFANVELYGSIGQKLLELPPGEVSPRTVRRGRNPGRANQTGRSQGSYRAERPAA